MGISELIIAEYGLAAWSNGYSFNPIFIAPTFIAPTYCPNCVNVK
jgi:hypothetical protein